MASVERIPRKKVKKGKRTKELTEKCQSRLPEIVLKDDQSSASHSVEAGVSTPEPLRLSKNSGIDECTVAASDASFHEQLEKSRDEHEVKLQNVSEVEDTPESVVPSAPPLSSEGTLVKGIRSLGELSLCSLYPLRTHSFHLPSQAVVHSHPLYVLVSDYLRSCTHLEHSLRKHKSLVAKADGHREMVWTVMEENIVESGKCKDQVPVVATYCRTSAVKDELHLSQLGNCLSAAREALHAECAFHLFDSEAHHLRVEHFVQAEEEAQAVLPSREELSTCVAILFSFLQRRDLNPNFISKIRGWLLRLGRALLQVALPCDRLLLLSQVLHCPKGVSCWAMPLIKFDPPPQITAFEPAIKWRPELEVVVEAISTIVDSPALRQFDGQLRNRASEDAWVVLDSAGEEEVLDVPGDEDLEVILDCIPLKAAVVHTLSLVGEECPASLSGVDVLKCFSLSNSVLKILGSCLMKPEMRRCPRFCKKLTMLIQHLIHLVSDFWELSTLMNHSECDRAMQDRVAVEYDALFIKIVGYLFQCSLRSCGWEALPKLPYKYLSLHARWHILVLFHHSVKENWFEDVVVPSQVTEGWMTESKESSPSFGATIMNASEQEASLLLTTIKTMALSCEDSTFAEAVAYDIFKVGYFNNGVPEKEFSKIANHLLASIFSKHPCLFSILINWLKEVSQEVEKGIVTLFSVLPVYLWQPSESDLRILSTWILQHDPQTVKSTVARVILLGMPWRELGKGDPLSLDASYAAAALALEACLMWDAKGRISQLASSVMWPESAISTWAWSLVSTLSLHSYERANGSGHSSQPAHPDSVSKDALLQVINRGLREAHPLACLLAVQATDFGNEWISAEKHAFSHLSVVAAHGKHIAAISALYLILPLFVDHLEELIRCKSFEKLLLQLLFADHTYMQMAANLIVSKFPGPILTEFGNMVVSHLEQSFRFGTTCTSLVCLWLNCIFLIPNWMHKKEALFLFDLVIRSAVLDEGDSAWSKAIFLLRKHKEQYSPPSEASRGTFSSLFTLLALEPSPGSPHPQSVVVRCSWPDFPWFVLAALDVEEEGEAVLWERIQAELGAVPSSVHLSTALKNACQRLDLQPFPVTCLTIFRWVRQALDTSLGHPALPLIWARFFSLYCKAFSSHRVGLARLFEGHSSCLALLAQVKKRLAESSEWYSKEAAANGVKPELSCLWPGHCTRLFRAFGLWLENVQHCSPLSSSLPVQYTPERLEETLLHAKRNLWRKDYIDVAQAKKSIHCALQSWDTLRGHYKRVPCDRDFDHYSAYSHPLQRILKRLQSCPDVFSSPFPPCSSTLTRSNHMQIVCVNEISPKVIRTCLRPLLECARLYSFYNSEHTALDCSLLELLPCLYEDTYLEFTRLVHCVQPSSCESSQSSCCSSPAKINFKVKESQVCEEVRARLETNLADRERLVTSVLHLAPHEACAAGVLLENMVRELVLGRKISAQSSKVHETALILLSSLLDQFSEDALSHCLPVKKLLTSCVETLGQEFVVGEERQLLSLLSQMIERSHLVGLLAPLLTPTAMSTSVFLQAYAILVRHLPNMDANVAFVLLSKFEISYWLSQIAPQRGERVHLVQLVIDGLSSCGTAGNNEQTLVSGLLQRHLRALLTYNLPEVFLEVIEFLLKASGDHCIQPFVWYDVLDVVISLDNIRINSKSCLPLLNAEISPEQLSSLLKEFATRQRVLTLEQVTNVTTFLADYFHHERLHFGLHGLYPKYRLHVKALQILLELLGHTLVAASNSREIGVFTSPGSFGYLWPALRNIFAPWLLPYWEDQLKEEGAFWILELMDGHPPLTPCIPSDAPYAHTMAFSFTRCIHFIMDVFPGHCNILNPVWEMYSASLARTGVGCHILEMIHKAFSILPWNQFWPSIQNLKDMVDVLERAPPECSAFVSTITPRIRWKEWIDSVMPSAALSAQALSSFLKLLMLLSSNPIASKVDTTSELLSLLVAAKAFPWHNLSTSDYADLLDLFLTRTSSEIVLGWNTPEINGREDLALLGLLRSIASLSDPHHEGLPQRCLPFFHTIVRLLAAATGEVGQMSPISGSKDAAFVGLLQESEAAVVRGFPLKGHEGQVTEMADVVKQVLLPILPVASPEFTKALSEAVAPKEQEPSHTQPNVLFAKGLLCALHYSSLPHAQLHMLVESALETSLLDKRDVFHLLDDVSKLLNSQGDRSIVVADMLSSSGHLLALSAYLRKSPLSICDTESLSGQSDESTLHLLVHRWLPAVTIVERVEPKMPLLWARALLLAQGQHQPQQMSTSCKNATEEDLCILASTLMNLGNGQEGMVSSLLGVIGLRKKMSPSKRFKVMCITIAAFVHAYLSGREAQDSRLKDALAGVEKMCRRHKELGEIATLATSAAMKPEPTLKDGAELIEKLLSRLFPEKSGYIHCIY